MAKHNLISAKEQMDGSLTNLFDTLNKQPLVHENKFDLRVDNESFTYVYNKLR